MKRFLPTFKILPILFVVMSLFFIEIAFAQRVASVSGNWNSTATWGGSAVPTSAQTVTINSGVTVTVNVAANAASLTVNGTLNVTGANLTITNGGSVVNNNGGSIVFNSTNVINGGGGGSNGILIDINPGANLTTAHANGFNNATGSFQHNAGNRAQTYDVAANYTYNGATQNTGANLPTNLTGSLTINSSGTVTLNSAKTIGNGGTINLDGGTFATGTNLTMASTSSITRSGGAVTGTFQGTGIYDVTYTGNSKTTGIELVNGGLNNVTVNLTSGQTLTLDANRTPDGNLNISSGIFDLSTFTVNRSGAGGTLTVSNGASLRIGGTNSFPSNYSTHSIGNTSTVEYFGTAQTVSNLNSSQSYGNLIFSGAGTKTLSSGTLGIAGNWTIGSTTAANTNNPTINLTGNFNLNSGTFSSTSGTFNIEGNWSNSGTFTAGTGTVNFDGTTQSIATTTFNNLLLTNSGVKTFSSTVTINANFSIAIGVQANLGTGLTHSANSLTLAGSGTNLGTWGSTTSSATYKNNTYFTATTGVVTIAANTAATPTVTPTVGTYTYTGLSQGPNAATNSGTGTSYTFSYIGVSGTVYGPSATLPINAGSYTVTATVADSTDGFYRLASSSATSFTIAGRALTITADNDSKTYGQTYAVGAGSIAFTSSGLQNGETIGTITIASAGAVNTAAVGTYDIIPSAATGGTFVAGNYSISYANGTLTVNAAALTVTANNANKVYGTTQSTPESGSTAFGSTGLQNGETIGTVTLTYGSGAIAATDAVGSTSTITPSAATGGTFTASNYNITYTPNSGILTVTVATLTITANNNTKVYGTIQSTPETGSTAFGSTGLQNGETIGTVTLTYGSGALAATDAVGSTSTITPSAAVGGTFTASNYSITYTPNSGTLTVTAAPLTITADNASKCFGTTYTLGTTAFTPTGLVLGETVGSVTLSSAGASSGAAAGTYSIVPSAAIGGTFTASNYSITYTNGTLTVNALPTAPTGTDGAICSTGTVNVSASVAGGETVDWYDASSGGVLLLSGSASYTTPSISSTTLYYAEARNTTTGCVSSTRTTVTATVYAAFTSGAIGTTGETVCYNGYPTLGINSITDANGGDNSITYVWQANGIDIPASNDATYDPPPGLTVTTTYTRYAKDNTCNPTFTISTGSWVVTISNDNTWTGSVSTDWATDANWSCGVVPASVSDVTISTASFYPIIASDVVINSLTLDSGTTLKVNSTYDLTVTDVITNNGTLTIENNGNLLQVNNVSNTGSGSTIVKRNSNPLIRLDYTLWSSPVSGQNLFSFSPLTSVSPNIRFYTYNSTINSPATTGFYQPVAAYATTDFDLGKGYLIRLPFNHPTAAAIWNGQFTGTANNGTHNVTITDTGDRFNAVGNPYPSPIDIAQFATDNSANIETSLYFWRKTNNAASPSYCAWNTTPPGSFVGNGQPWGDTTLDDPLGVIQTGQGFFVQAKTGASTLVFNNGQRTGDNSNNFFKDSVAATSTTTIEANRIWLNMTGASGFSQSLVGYYTNATVGQDDYDSKYFNDGPIAFTSTIANQDYVIQGRPVPFDSADVVPMKYKVTTAGNFTIAIDHVDGLFSTGQTIYLRDNLTASIHNLTTGGYSFVSNAGTFDSRFEIIYALPLGNVTPIFSTNSVIIYNQNNEFVVNTGSVIMNSIKVFDIRGRLLEEKKEINATQTTIGNGLTNQVLLVQITSEDGITVTKKVIR